MAVQSGCVPDTRHCLLWVYVLADGLEIFSQTGVPDVAAPQITVDCARFAGVCKATTARWCSPSGYRCNGQTRNGSGTVRDRQETERLPHSSWSSTRGLGLGSTLRRFLQKFAWVLLECWGHALRSAHVIPEAELRRLQTC